MTPIKKLFLFFIATLMLIMTICTAAAVDYEYDWMSDFYPTGAIYTLDDNTLCYQTNTTHGKCVDNDGDTIKTIGLDDQTLGITGFQAFGNPVSVMISSVTDYNNDKVFYTTMRKNSTNGQFYLVKYDYVSDAASIECTLPSFWADVNVVAALQEGFIISRTYPANTMKNMIVDRGSCSVVNMTTAYFPTNGNYPSGSGDGHGTPHPLYYSGNSFFMIPACSSGGSGSCQGFQAQYPGYYVLIANTNLQRGCLPTSPIPGMPAVNCTFNPKVGMTLISDVYTANIRDTGSSEQSTGKPHFNEYFNGLVPAWEGLYGFEKAQNSSVTLTLPASGPNIAYFDLLTTSANSFVGDYAIDASISQVTVQGDYVFVKTNSNTNLTVKKAQGGVIKVLNSSELPIIIPDIAPPDSYGAYGPTMWIVADTGLLYTIKDLETTSEYSEEYDLDLFGRIELTSDVSYGFAGHPCDSYYLQGSIPYTMDTGDGCNPYNDSSTWPAITPSLLQATSSYGNSIYGVPYKELYENNTYMSEYNPVSLLIVKDHTDRTLNLAVVCDEGVISTNNPILYYMDASNESEVSLNSACNITRTLEANCDDSISDEYIIYNTTSCTGDAYKTTGVRENSYTLTQDFFMNSGETTTMQVRRKSGASDLTIIISSMEDVGMSGEDRFSISINGVEAYNSTQASWPGSVMEEPDRTLITMRLAVNNGVLQYEFIGREAQFCNNKPLIATGTMAISTGSEPYSIRYATGASGGVRGESGIGDLLIQRGNTLPSYTSGAPDLIYTSPVTGREFYTTNCDLSSGAQDHRSQQVAVYHSFDSDDYTNKTEWTIGYDETLAGEKQLSTINGGVSGSETDAANAQNAQNFFCSALNVCSPSERLLFAVITIVLCTILTAMFVYSQYQATFAAHASTVGVFTILFVTFASLKFLPTWFVVVFCMGAAGGLVLLIKGMFGGNNGGQ